MMDKIVGQKKQILEIVSFINGFKRGRALLVHGPPGVGKTSSIHQIAEEKGMEIFEVNASDKRNPKELEKSAERASRQKSFFGNGKIILIDEVDNLSERGGVSKIMQIISNSSHPMILTANDPWKTKLRALRKKCRMVEFKPLSLPELRQVLSGLTSNNELIEIAVRNAEGDARAAINNLCMPAIGMEKRHQKQNVFQIMKKIFKSKGEEALYWINRLDMGLDDFKYWIMENITNEIRNSKDVADAYEAVSRADLFLARSRRTQYYPLLRHVRVLLSLGVSTSNRNPHQGFTRYQSPSRIKKIARTKKSRQETRQKARQMSEKCHLSSKKARTEILPYLRFISKTF